jgi:hypothetical protein
MNALTVWLYISSGVVIGLLVAFAKHNRKVGWKKSRTTLSEALDDFYADLGFSVRAPEPERSYIVTSRPAEPVDQGDFSDQLIRLKNALGDAATVTQPEVEEKKRGRETAPIQRR